jgi:hypothetical protein
VTLGTEPGQLWSLMFRPGATSDQMAHLRMWLHD